MGPRADPARRARLPPGGGPRAGRGHRRRRLGGAGRRAGRPALPGRLHRPSRRGGRCLQTLTGRSTASTARWWSATPTSSAARRWPTPRRCARPGSGASCKTEPKRESLFSGVPTSLPALLAAYRLTQKAAGVGFDWPDAAQVLDKAEEEIAEVREALAPGRQGRRARGGGRPPLHPRQPRPQARRRPRGRPRRHQPQVPPALRQDRGGPRRPGQDRGRGHAGGDGRAVGGGEGGGTGFAGPHHQTRLSRRREGAGRGLG